MDNKVWAFDIDGVVSNAYKAIKKEIGLLYNIYFEGYMPYNPSNLFEIIDMKKIFDTIFKNINTCEVINNSVETITDYYENTNRIVFITSRELKYYKETLLWLKQYFYFHFELYCEIAHDDKHLLSKLINCKGIIDDNPSICRSFLNNSLDHICHSQPHHVYENLDGLKVMNWGGIRKEIL